jgi:hypothetical protein
MRCEEIKQELKALHDGELRGVTAYKVNRHVRRCAECSQVYRKMGELHATLRAADLFTPTIAPTVARRGARRAVAGLLSAAALTAIIAAALLLVPPGKPTRVLAADVREALGRVKTWHLNGWRIIHGKKVQWEIWGRTAPYLYYERNGDDVVSDDGQVRTYYFAAAPALGRAKAMVIVASSKLKDQQTLRPNWERIAEDQGMAQVLSDPYIKPERSDRKVTVFRRQDPFTHLQGVNVNQLLAVSSGTRLPINYRLHYNRVHDEWDTEYLEAHYDLDIPPVVSAPAWPAGHAMLDMRGSETLPEHAAGAHVGGIHVTAKPQAVDRDGNVVIEVTGDFQGSRIPTLAEGMASPYPLVLYTSATAEPVEAQCTDRSGHVIACKYVDAYFHNGGRPDARFLLSPVNPLSKGIAPSRIRHRVTVSIMAMVDGTDLVGYQGAPTYPNTRSITLMTQACPLTVDVLRTPGKDFVLTPPGASQDRQPLSNAELNRVVYDARAIYWWDNRDYLAANLPKKFTHEDLLRNPKLVREYGLYLEAHSKEFKRAKTTNLLRAIDWLSREVELIPPRGRDGFERMNKLMQMASWCIEAGRPDLARNSWRRVIREAKRIPNTELFVKNARDFLNGKQPGAS